MDSLEATEFMADSVTCAYPLSGMYGTTTTYTYYAGILLLLIGPAKAWFAIASATNAAPGFEPQGGRQVKTSLSRAFSQSTEDEYENSVH
jgi:hypothetical protein